MSVVQVGDWTFVACPCVDEGQAFVFGTINEDAPRWKPREPLVRIVNVGVAKDLEK